MDDERGKMGNRTNQRTAKTYERPVRRGGRPGADTNPIFNPGGGIRPSGNSHRNVKIGLQNDTTIDFVFDYTSSAKNILPVIYIFCRDVMQACQSGTGRVRFGVTFLSDEAESKQWKNKDFTSVQQMYWMQC